MIKKYYYSGESETSKALDEIIQQYKDDEDRIIIDDQYGFTLYVGDLDMYQCEQINDTLFKGSKMKTISITKKPKESYRVQIGSHLQTVPGDAIFIIKEDNGQFKKYRADQLKTGMITHEEEKVIIYGLQR